MSAKPNSSILAKIIGAAATLIAAWLVQRIIGSVWKARTGHKPPTADDDDGNANLTELVTAAAVTGALVAISRVLATRGAAHVVAAIEDDDDDPYFD